MKQIAISQLTTLRWDLQQEVAAAKERGIKGIGLWRPKVDDCGLDQIAEYLFENRIAVSSVSWVEGGGFNGSDGSSFEEAVDDAIDAVRDAEMLGAETLIVVAGSRNKHTKRHARKNLCDALREVDRAARLHDIKLAIEPVHAGCGDEWSFVNDIRSALDVVGEINSDNFGLVLDTYHLGHDCDVQKWLPNVIPYLHLVQLGDARHSPMGEMNRCLLGDGNVPIPAILEMLATGGYDRWIEIELLGADVEPLEYETVLDHSLDYLHRCTTASSCA